MAYLPINLDIRNRRCVVVGGGSVAERKVEALREFDADVLVVAPRLTPALESLVSENAILHESREFSPECLHNASLVIAATGNHHVNASVSFIAERLRIPVNVVDDPVSCTFIMPAIVRRGDLVISVSTSGKSPLLARRIKERLESEIGSEYGVLVELIGILRNEVQAKYADPDQRKQALERIFDSEMLAMIASGEREQALEAGRSCI